MNQNTTKTTNVTVIMDYKSKKELFKDTIKLDLALGDEVILNKERFVIQSVVAISEGPTFPDPAIYGENKPKKEHAGFRRKMITYTYKAALAGTGKNLTRYDLSNKKTIKLK